MIYADIDKPGRLKEVLTDVVSQALGGGMPPEEVIDTLQTLILNVGIAMYEWEHERN